MKKENYFRDETVYKFYSLPLSIRRIIVSNFLYENNNFHVNGECILGEYGDFVSLSYFSGGYGDMPREIFNLSGEVEKLFFDFLEEKDVFNKQK